MGALSAHVHQAWMGTTVTCPTLRYSPAVVAEAFCFTRSVVVRPDLPGRRIRRGAE
jgi:hypothetical protein